MNNETRIGPSPLPIEIVRILNLEPVIVIVGIGRLFEPKLLPLVNNRNRTREENWQYLALDAVDSITRVELLLDLGPNIQGNAVYQEAVQVSLDYMRFLGFSESDLTADGIAAAADAVEIELDPTKAGMLNLTERLPLRHSLPTRVVDISSRRRLTSSEFDKISEDRLKVLGLLDRLMETYNHFPSLEEQERVTHRLLNFIFSDQEEQ